MTQAKKVAKTLKSVLDHPVMKVILDKSSDIETVIDEVTSWWRYDLMSRKPGPAYINDEFVGTDLDLACFLFELAERKAVINIPQYKSMRARTIREGEHVISSENRHGNILELIANKETFTFSVRMNDANVVTTEGVGAFRNFSITDLDGDWYAGWGHLEFLPNATENKFIFENDLTKDGNIDFTNFVHPNRWSSIFGHHYFITKALIERLKEEGAHYNKEMKRMLTEGIKYPPKDAPPEWAASQKGESKKIKVRSFEVELDIPSNDSRFPSFESNVDNLIALTQKRNYFVFKLSPKFNFAVRTCEYAYNKYGNGRVPAWLQNVSWENDYVAPGKRTKWDRIVLFQPEVGKVGVSLKKRVYETTQEVAIDYDHRKGKLRNYVAMILDESGSMDSIKNEIIGAFNQQVDTIKSNSSDMETYVSLVKFNTFVPKPVLWNKPDTSLNKIDSSVYDPTGMTALNDAIGMTINELKKVDDVDDPLTSFLLIVLSDGEENASKKYPRKFNKELAALIKEVQDTNRWTVTFIGANQDMTKLSENFNIPMGNVTAFDATTRGVEKASFTVSAGLNSYYTQRRSGETSVKSFYDSGTK